MPSSSWALQQALYSAVTGSAPLAALIGPPRVYDDVPQGAAFPYLTLGQSTLRDWSTGTDDAEEHTLTLHVWSRAGGRREMHEVMDALRGALHDQPLVLAGHRLVNIRHEISEARRDPDGETYHGIVRFRAVTEPA
jgi:hypothetical protein